MPTSEVPAGETVELVSGNPGDAFYVSVEDGEVRVASNRSVARAGRRLRTDDRAEVTLRERGEGVFVYAETDASVLVEKQGFTINLFNREVVRRPSDRSAEDQRVNSASADTTVPSSGTTETYYVFENNTGRTLYLFRGEVAHNSGSLESPSTATLFTTDGSSVQFESPRNINDWVWELDTAVPVPDGGSIGYEFVINGPEDIGVTMAATYRY